VYNIILYSFLATVCKTVRPMLSDRCLSVPSVCNVGVLWPNGWMNQDETWQAGRPWPWLHCARWGLSSPPLKGQSPQFSAHIYCGQTAGWIKMPLGIMEVAWRSPSSTVWPTPHTVLDGDPALPLKRGHSPHFRPMSIVVKRSPISATAEHL